VRWVAEFLRFARAHAGYSFEQTLDLFLAEVGGRAGTKPWQLQQVSDAIRIYRYQYPMAEAARVAMTTIAECLAGQVAIETVRIVLHGQNAYEIHLRVLRELG
jgi:hypothetical protein